VSTEQLQVVTILLVTMCFFMWNRWRYVAAVFSGIVPAEEAFTGFSHPAVITVACVLVISQAIQLTGVIEFFLRLLARTRRTFIMQISANSVITALLSAFMNNVGALALMLPVTVRDARRAKRSPHQLLMPLSFASLLGGLVTMIGTPPNIVIATFRTDTYGEPFGMFDFTPVGLTVACGGILFIVLIGWRLIPLRDNDESKHYRQFKINDYVTEASVGENSSLINATIGELEELCEGELTVLSIIRGSQRFLAPRTSATIQRHDVLVLQGDSTALQPLFDNPGLLSVGVGSGEDRQIDSSNVRIVEVVVMPDAMIEGQAMRAVHLHTRFGVNLLAVSRKDSPLITRLRSVRFQVGDVLLLQGERDRLHQIMQNMRLLPLANRGISLQQKKHATLTLGVFAASVLAAALDIVPVQIAFAAAALSLVLFKAIPLNQAYRSVEWPVIVLLGSLIPLGEALQSTGTTELIASSLADIAGGIPIYAVVALIIMTSMILSDLVHNTP